MLYFWQGAIGKRIYDAQQQQQQQRQNILSHH